MPLIRYVGDQPRDESSVTANSSRWWPGEMRRLESGARANALLSARQGWELVTDADGATVQPLTAAQVQAVQSLIDGSGIDVSFVRAHDSIVAAYVLDAGAATVLPVMRVTVEAPTFEIAGARIAAGGVNTFETTIDGNSTEGEVIPISVGDGVITRVYIGSSLGTSQTVASSGTATVNQLALFSCLEADDCNVVYVRFGPPRVSGRYCDVSIVGKRRA